MFFLIYLLVFVALIVASWFPAIAKQPIGITEVFPAIWESTKKTLSFEGNGLAIIAFAFLIYAVLKSKSFEALFASKRKGLQKRRFATIAIITVAASLLASNFGGADEFLHFYPLLVPLLLAMGFDVFSSVLCLGGGTVVGVVGSMNCEPYQGIFKQYVNEKAHTNFTGTEGVLFRVIVGVILTTILVFFNIGYCNKIQKKSTALPAKEVKPEKPPTFNGRRKLVLFFAFFFVLISVLGSIPGFAKITKGVSENIPQQICSDEKVVNHEKLGTVKVSPDSSSKENEIKIAEVKKPKKSSGGKFGEGDTAQKCYGFTIGGIIICLIAKLNVIDTLIAAITKVIPIIIIYIFSYTVPMLIGKMKLKINPFSPLLTNRFVALPAIFVVLFVLCFFSINIMRAILPVIAPTLKSLSTNTLAYSVTAMTMGRFLADGVSPMDGNLQMTLKTNKLSYKQYIKKTWFLGTIIFLVCLALIIALPFFIDRGGG